MILRSLKTPLPGVMIIVAVLLAVLLGQNAAVVSASGGIVRVGGNIANTASSATSVSVSYTATVGNVLVAVCGTYGSASLNALTITDGSNSYTLDGFQVSSASGDQEKESLSHTRVTTGGALTITCTANAAAPYGMTVAVVEYSGVSTVTDGLSATFGTGTTVNSGNITTTNASNLLVGALVSGDGAGLTAGTGWTMVQSSATGYPASVGVEERIVSSTGTYAATATTASSARWASIILALENTSAGGNIPRKHRVTETDTGWTPSGSLSAQVVATDGLYTNGNNVVGNSKNNLATYNNKQYLCYINGTLHVVFAVKSLPSGIPIITDTGFLVANDEHYTCAVAIDAAGYIHLSYGMHNEPLKYRKSTNPEDVSSWSSILPMVGTHESSVSYPMFLKSPGGTLYFTFRDGGSGNGDQYFYVYDGSAWHAASGTGTNGIIIAGLADNLSAYLNGLPQFDSSGNLWWNWSWNVLPSINEYVMKWDGTSFKTPAGGAQVIPATNGNTTPVVTTSNSNLQIQNGFCVDSSNVVYIPYVRNDGSGILQEWVAESSSGSFVEHQLTNNASANTGNTVPVPYSACVSVGSTTYVVYPDNFGTQRRTVALASSDHFSTWTTFYPFLYYNPNWELNPDPTRLANGVVSFLYMDTNDPLYGANYIAPPNISTLGYVSVLDWTPNP